MVAIASRRSSVLLKTFNVWRLYMFFSLPMLYFDIQPSPHMSGLKNMLIFMLLYFPHVLQSLLYFSQVLYSSNNGTQI